jgi:murein DD-endopeptidase MepM/ murein hydrolase activator NlpD
MKWLKNISFPKNYLRKNSRHLKNKSNSLSNSSGKQQILVNMATDIGSGLLGRELSFKWEVRDSEIKGSTGSNINKQTKGNSSSLLQESTTLLGKCEMPPPKDSGKGYGQFPVEIDLRSYLTSPGKYGSRRDGQRLHAGADIYGSAGAKVYAIKDGFLTESPRLFPLSKNDLNPKSYSIVIDHGDFVGRYCEIIPEKGLKKGSFVFQGMVIGRIAELWENKKSNMLHFEMYSKNARGPLTQKKANIFERRSDVMNPEPFLNCFRRNDSSLFQK